MKSCITCGMPFVGAHESDIGIELPEGPVCTFDSENGSVKSAQDIFNGGIGFFSHAVTGGDRALATRLTRKNMKSLPYWQTHHFVELDGDTATDEEFAAAMAKLQLQ